MKLTSARSSRAPAPFRIAKRAAAIFVARSRSRMPSAAPRSTWSSGSKENSGRVPQRRTSVFADSSAPTGTDECGMFGKVDSISRMRSSVCVRSPSSSAMRSLSPLTSARRASASSFLPSFINAPISRLEALRCALSWSDSAIVRRRSSSARAKSSSAFVSAPRAFSASRTLSKFSLT